MCTSIYFSAVKPSIPCSKLFLHFSWTFVMILTRWDQHDFLHSYISICHSASTKCWVPQTLQDFLFKKHSSPLPFPFLIQYIGFPWPAFDGGGLQLYEAASVSNRTGMVEQPLGFKKEEEESLHNNLWLEREVRREETILQTPRDRPWSWDPPAAHGGSPSGARYLNVTLLVDVSQCWSRFAGRTGESMGVPH